MARQTKAQQAEQQDAINELRALIKPGDTVWTAIRHVSSSGMMRTIQVILLRNGEDGRGPSPLWIGYTVAKALALPYDTRREGVRIGGCGMDMGFNLVYELSSRLYGFSSPDGYPCMGKDCPSNHHQSAHWQDYTGEPVHRDGYALRHRWL